jgi:hypothetical protein
MTGGGYAAEVYVKGHHNQSSVPDPWRVATDETADPCHWFTDPDPALFFSDFQDARKIRLFKKLFLLTRLVLIVDIGTSIHFHGSGYLWRGSNFRFFLMRIWILFSLDADLRSGFDLPSDVVSEFPQRLQPKLTVHLIILGFISSRHCFGSALIWLSWIRIRIGNADPDPGP